MIYEIATTEIFYNRNRLLRQQLCR